MKRVEVAIAIVFKGKQVLICRRRDDAPSLAGYWEFPGGKIHVNESPEACACREVFEETGVTVRATRALSTIEHTYPDVHIGLHPIFCTHVANDPQPIVCNDPQWVEVASLKQFRFPPANDALIDELMRGQLG